MSYSDTDEAGVPGAGGGALGAGGDCGVVTSAMLKELFSAPLLTLPGQESADGMPPVLDARVDAQGKFAFIEFRTEALATTALTLFHNMELCGRSMSVARPTG